MKTLLSKWTMGLLVAAVLGAPMLAGATPIPTVDLSLAGCATPNFCSGIINGGVFQNMEVAPAGTGVFDTFVRMQDKPIEEGYNTDGRPVAFDELTDAQHTHSILLSAVSTKLIGQSLYREFFLDIHQNNGPGVLLSLDAVKLFMSPTGDSTSANLANGGPLGTLIYDLDAGGDKWVKLSADNSFAHGSGSSDMAMYILDSLFTGPNTYVTLYSMFGVNYSANATFEEWAVQTPASPPPPAVPEPASVLLMGTGLVGLAGWARRRQRNG